MKPVILILLCLLSLTLANEGTGLFRRAKSILESLPNPQEGQLPRYTFENSKNGVDIPAYDSVLQRYEDEPLAVLDEATLRPALDLLEEASNAGNIDATVELGDIYMFGKYSVPTNYTRGYGLYTQAVANRPHGHAYFMLGYIHSTGLFGEVPVDPKMADVFYEFAAQNGDYNALLALANRYYHGIDRPENCEMAQFYYSRAARIAMKHIHDTGEEPAYNLLLFNVKLLDFNGGLYGNKLSEGYSTVVTKVNSYISTRDALRETNINDHDHDLAEFYFSALQNYNGGYFLPRNYTKAYEAAKACCELGEIRFGRNPHNLNNVNKYIWSRAMNLLGQMYLKGHGAEKNIVMAFEMLKNASSIYLDERDYLYMGLLHKMSPAINGAVTDNCTANLKKAISEGSAHGAYHFAKLSISQSDESPFVTVFDQQSFGLMRSAAFSGHYEAMFYFADALESGFTSGKRYTCSNVVSYYKDFVERSESILMPHLKYAFEEFTYGHYKNALLGYLIAAEQGLMNSQVTAAYLLYQTQPLFLMKPKSFDPVRVESAMRYLELAALQGDVDATLMLGDLNFNGVPKSNITKNYANAFAYYNKAALSASAHGCYKLGYMYEYGLGTANDSVDYFMAKRFYDFGIKNMQNSASNRKKGLPKTNTHAMNLALLRLRLKLMFSGAKTDNQLQDTAWISTFKQLGKQQESDLETPEYDKANAKAQAHHEGGTFDEEEEYEIIDYILLIATLCFFLYVFVENMRGRFRQMRAQQNGENPPDEVQDQGHFDANVQFQRGNFQFHFFAI